MNALFAIMSPVRMVRISRSVLLRAVGAALLHQLARSSLARAQRFPPDDVPPLPLQPRRPSRPLRLPASARVPILMYHYISDPPADANRLRRNLSVSPKTIEQHLRYLAEHGYSTISLYDLYAHLSEGRPLPPQSVILTFDDGYLDAYTIAFPLLKQYGMRGTFFIVTDFINYRNPNHITWDMAREMFLGGMNVESHGRTHSDLRKRSFQFLVWEVLGPLEQIAHYVGHRPRFFCYPAGQYDDHVIAMLRSVHKWGAVTTQHGYLHTLQNAMTWPRVRVTNESSIQSLLAVI